MKTALNISMVILGIFAVCLTIFVVHEETKTLPNSINSHYEN